MEVERENGNGNQQMGNGNGLREMGKGMESALCGAGQALLELKVTRPVGGSVEVEESSPLEDSVEDGSCQILIV